MAGGVLLFGLSQSQLLARTSPDEICSIRWAIARLGSLVPRL